MYISNMLIIQSRKKFNFDSYSVSIFRPLSTNGGNYAIHDPCGLLDFRKRKEHAHCVREVRKEYGIRPTNRRPLVSRATSVSLASAGMLANLQIAILGVTVISRWLQRCIGNTTVAP